MRKSYLVLIFMLIVLLAISTSLMAADQVVTNNDDTGAGSLRQAIVDVTTGCTITFNLSSGNETITTASQFSISGKDFTIDGDNTAGSGTNITLQANASPWTATHRLFYISTSGTDLTVKNMTIQNGCRSVTFSNANKGGAFYLANTTSLTLENCTVKNNRGSAGGFLYLSYRGQSCTLTDCTISGNKADNQYGNGCGGAIDLSLGGSITATNTTFSGNSCESNGSGGAIYLWATLSGTNNITLTNCTISGNSGGTSTNSYGGAVYIMTGGNNAPVTNLSLTNCTIDGNTGNKCTGIYCKSAFDNISSYTVIALGLKNCIISNGISLNYVEEKNASGGEIVITRTYTLCEDATLPDGSINGNIDSDDPELLALALNNNPNGTYTHCFSSSSSPCIDAGTNTGAPTTDQRGAEIYNSTKDMGSYEWWGSEGALPVTLSSFTASYVQGSEFVTIMWTTQSETNNLGWNIYRSETNEISDAFQINSNIILGAGTTTEPNEYTFIDEYEVESGETYWYWLESIEISGFTETYGPISLLIPEEGDDPESPDLPKIYGLHQNYPNPFNPGTEIGFSVKTTSPCEVSIYDIRGRKIATLFNDIATADEIYHFVWNGEDKQGKQVSSGIYYYRLITPEKTEMRKMLHLK